MSHDKVKESPEVDTTISTDSLYCCNNCGVAFKPKDRIIERDKSNIDSTQYYLIGDCPACDENRPTLIQVGEDNTNNSESSNKTENTNTKATSD